MQIKRVFHKRRCCRLSFSPNYCHLWALSGSWTGLNYTPLTQATVHVCVCFSGYGHTVPLSDGGKAFCIVYSLLGIPVTLFFLSIAVKRIMVLVTRRPVSYFHRRWAMSKSMLATVHAVCLAVVICVVFVFIPAWIFTSLEKDWDFLESLYFCFISLTTIGLGDYVPGESHSKEDNPHPQLYRLAITCEYRWLNIHE